MKEQYAEGIKIIKRKRKFKVLGIFALSVICILMVCSFSSILSKTLNLGNFSLASLILGQGNNKIEKHTLYAVTLGEFEDKKQCQDVALGSSVAGASGYVWKNSDKSYYAIGSIYSSLEDAQKVSEGLQNSIYMVEIKEINFKEVRFDVTKKDKDVISLCVQSLSYLNDLYNNFQTTCVQLEKGEISYVASASFINAYKSEIKTYETKFDLLLKENSDDVVKKLLAGFVAIETSLDNTVNTLLSNFSPVSDIKYGLADFVFNYHSLILVI